MKIQIKKCITLFCICYICILLSSSPIRAEPNAEVPLTAHFAPELTPGSNFTWVVNEWDQLDDWLNPEANYVPQPGDQWMMRILGELPDIPVSSNISWDVMGWHIENFDFPTLDSKEDSPLLLNISGHSFFEVFGNTSDNGHNWVMVNHLFLLPYTIDDENGDEQSFGKFCYAKLENLEVDVEVNVSDHDLKLQGSITGEYEEVYIELECHLGLKEQFVYKRKPIGSQLYKGVLNITLIKSEFNSVTKPNIPGYSYLLGIGSMFVGAITILVQHQISKVKKKKG